MHISKNESTLKSNDCILEMHNTCIDESRPPPLLPQVRLLLEAALPGAAAHRLLQRDQDQLAGPSR